ncbi:MAG: Uridine diphosphate glucose pyrophosphatase (EC [uncultured Campylobacterales bacterium]|uniref:Uridine diphosphate glucose pyrophosphatase (EC) n=1 Tax=uncultured Campylobacterales bacterium TaxID=352960 RepID=A0A6S6T1U3_9BACT|nr:MAG: Uridine diphosphate glucose pyrophosphatase (EC [uncultured Campylobacterales bacterium]
MKNIITEFKTSQNKHQVYQKPLLLNYNLNGKDRSWEAVRAHESVAVLLYHKDKKAFLLVKQFRAPVYLHNQNYTFTYELCAGLIDKDKGLKTIVQEEIYEECGYKVNTQNIEKITSFVTNVGISGASQYLYYTEIDDSMKVNDGGGLEDEDIELFYLDIKEYKNFIFDESKVKTPGVMYAFMWWYDSKKIKNFHV